MPNKLYVYTIVNDNYIFFIDLELSTIQTALLPIIILFLGEQVNGYSDVNLKK
jgi:hypothetical protein